MPERLSILLVEDSDDAVRSVVRVAGKVADFQIVRTVVESLAVLDRGLRADGAIVDNGLPDGTGLEVVEALRGRHPRLPVLIVTGLVNVELINRAQQLGAEYAVKPDVGVSLLAFLDRVRLRGMDPGVRARGHIDAFVRSRALSPTEAEILRLAVLEKSRAEIASALGVTINTVKTEAQRMVAKMGGSLGDVARRLREEIGRS
jgi:two-component system nitrate/nitrite response regulator NarP